MRQGATMLTAKQKSMLNVLIEHLEKHDVPPSFEELAQSLISNPNRAFTAC